MMEKFLKLAEKDAEYAELHHVKVKGTRIDALNKQVKEISNTDVEGYGIRVLCNGAWGQSFSYQDNFKKLIKDAVENAKKSIPYKKNLIKIDKLANIKKKFKVSTKIPFEDVELEQKRGDLLALDLSNEYKKVFSTRLYYSDIKTDFSFVNSEGRDLLFNDSAIGIMIWTFARDGVRQENHRKIERAKAGYEYIQEKGEGMARYAFNAATDMLKAGSSKGGKFPVVIDQKLGGVLAHEAVGHACEADLVLSNLSILKGKIGERIGNNFVNISDNGSLKKWGWVPFDNEGVEGSNTVLIKNGILKSYIHNRSTATQMNVKPTGNGRRQGLNNVAIPRMTNTGFEKGSTKHEDIFKDIKEGYYLKGSYGGQVNPASGSFLFNAAETFEIKDGEIGDRVRAASLIGNIMDALKKVELIGKDVEYGTGYCGKAGQNVPVSDYAPHLKLAEAMVGGQK